jgi:hypothetical protein
MTRKIKEKSVKISCIEVLDVQFLVIKTLDPELDLDVDPVLQLEMLDPYPH